MVDPPSLHSTREAPRKFSGILPLNRNQKIDTITRMDLDLSFITHVCWKGFALFLGNTALLYRFRCQFGSSNLGITNAGPHKSNADIHLI